MPKLVRDNVRSTLLGMAVPMLAGTFAMNAYNLTDTWYVSRLGTLPLAAMGFTFPVVMLLTFVAAGIGTGVTTLVSHALGRQDHPGAARIVSHGLALMLAVAAGMAVAGYCTIGPVFRGLGASGETRRLIGEYMRIWYLGAPFMALPMVGNGILMACGDSRRASRLMILGTLLNALLDPIMIFGWAGFPAMGLRGAALATVIAQAVATACLLLPLWRRHHLVETAAWSVAAFAASCRRILAFGIPSIMSMALMPVSAAVITKIIGAFGNEAVAACGAAGRIEMFAFVIPMALGISLTPFVSQNFGASRPDRIREAMQVSMRFALGYGLLVALLFFPAAPWLAAIFTKDPRVAQILVAYIRTISFGYGMMEVHRYCGFFLTGMHKPFSTTSLNCIRVLVLLIPLSLLGADLWGLQGVFFSRLATDLTAGGLGLFWVRGIVGRHAA